MITICYFERIMSIFVYGTLLFSEVWQALIHRTPDMRFAVLDDYERYAVFERLYPGLVGKEKASTQGMLVVDLCAEEIEIVDSYEGGDYTKIGVDVLCEGETKSALVYIRTPRQEDRPLSPWCPNAFQETHLRRFLGL